MGVTSLSLGNQLLMWQRWLKLFCYYPQIYHFRSKKGTAAEMRTTVVSGMVTGDALSAALGQFFILVASNSPTSLFES